MDNFITRQKSKSVVVTRENLNNVVHVFDVCRGVCCPWLQVVEMLVGERSVDIQN